MRDDIKVELEEKVQELIDNTVGQYGVLLERYDLETLSEETESTAVLRVIVESQFCCKKQYSVQFFLSAYEDEDPKVEIFTDVLNHETVELSREALWEALFLSGL